MIGRNATVEVGLLIQEGLGMDVPGTLGRLIEIIQTARNLNRATLQWIRLGPEGLVWQTTDGQVHREHRWV